MTPNSRDSIANIFNCNNGSLFYLPRSRAKIRSFSRKFVVIISHPICPFRCVCRLIAALDPSDFRISGEELRGRSSSHLLMKTKILKFWLTIIEAFHRYPFREISIHLPISPPGWAPSVVSPGNFTMLHIKCNSHKNNKNSSFSNVDAFTLFAAYNSRSSVRLYSTASSN